MAELILGDFDPNRNFSEKDVYFAVNAIEAFNKCGGQVAAQKLGISCGEALQRFAYPSLQGASSYDREFSFDVANIQHPCLTKNGKKQSPSFATFCRRAGILNDGDGNFSLSSLGRAVLDRIITPQEYVFVLLSKQGPKLSVFFFKELITHSPVKDDPLHGFPIPITHLDAYRFPYRIQNGNTVNDIIFQWHTAIKARERNLVAIHKP